MLVSVRIVSLCHLQSFVLSVSLLDQVYRLQGPGGAAWSGPIAAWGSLARFLASLGLLLAPSCCHVALSGPFSSHLGALGPHLGAFFGCLGIKKVVKNHVFFCIFLNMAYLRSDLLFLRSLGPFLSLFLALLGASWGLLEPSWSSFGAFLGLLGGLWGPLGGSGASQDVSQKCKIRLFRALRLLNPSWTPFWEVLGSILRGFFVSFETFQREGASFS